MTKVKKVFVREGQRVEKGFSLIQFDDTGIFKAPFAGTVTKLPFNAPDTILPHVSALTLQNLKEKYLEVSLEQEGALRVSKGQKAKVLFESVRGEKFDGEVIALFPKDDEFLAHIRVPGLGENVLPGMTADVSIIVGKHRDALLVPIGGLSNGILIVRRDGKKMKVPVKIGGIDGEWAEVLEGDIKMTDEILLKMKNGSSAIGKK
jgi:multidrug efflux pump subunit AcrA (membrane-fusion protein)